MKFCVNCGRQLNDSDKFCPDCGYKNSINNQMYHVSEINDEPIRKKKPGCLVVILAFIVVMAIIIAISVATATNKKSNGGQKESNEVAINQDNDTKQKLDSLEPQIIIDVNEYRHLSGEELIAKLGEPDSIEDGPYSGALGLECTWYLYGDADLLGDVQFELIDDKVERFGAYNTWRYPGKEKLLESFGIEKEDTCCLEADTDTTVRYIQPSSNIGELSAELIEGNEFEFLRVTYDLGLYREGYTSTGSEEKTNNALNEVLIETEFIDLYDYYGKSYNELVQTYPRIMKAENQIQTSDTNSDWKYVITNAIINGEEGKLLIAFNGDNMVCKAFLFARQLNDPTALYRTMLIEEFREPVIQKFGEPTFGDTVYNKKDAYESLIKNEEYDEGWQQGNLKVCINYDPDYKLFLAFIYSGSIEYEEGLLEELYFNLAILPTIEKAFDVDGEIIDPIDICKFRSSNLSEVVTKYDLDIDNINTFEAESGKKLFALQLPANVEGIDGKLLLIFDASNNQFEYAVFMSCVKDYSQVAVDRFFRNMHSKIASEYGEPNSSEISMDDGNHYGIVDETWDDDAYSISISNSEPSRDIVMFVCGNTRDTGIDDDLIEDSLLWFLNE